MANIINFPRVAQATIENTPPKEMASTSKPAKVGFRRAILRGFWVVTALVWPLLKWVLSIDCFFQLVRMIYYWDTPGTYAGWTFLGHFVVLTAMTYFVTLYKPKGL